MFGPESTGKTTLSIQLAEYYKTEWVPEFARIIYNKNGITSQFVMSMI
jgi:nicotinamide riboside kinase